MISRFNFFDFFGYLLPGAFLFLLVGIPVAVVVKPDLPDIPTSLVVAASAFGLVLAYGTGLVLQQVAQQVLPSKVRLGEVAEDVHPSTGFLDSSNDTLDEESRKLLRDAIKSDFNLELERENPNASAFFFCRSRVLASGKASYCEQFQGLYTMMRGLSLSSYIASAVVLGLALGELGSWDWGDGAWKSFTGHASRGQIWPSFLVVLLLAYSSFKQCQRVLVRRGYLKGAGHGLIATAKAASPVLRRRIWMGVGVLGVLIGFPVSISGSMNPVEFAWFVPGGVGLFLLGLIFREAHIEFASTFARTVYVDYLAHRAGK